LKTGVALIASPPSVTAFPTSPVSVVIDGVAHGHVWLGREVRWEQLEDDVVVLDVIGGCDAKPFYCAGLNELTPVLWRGNLVADNPPGLTVVVRPTVEEDAAWSSSFEPFASFPLPIPVLRDVLATGEFEAPELHTLWNGDALVGLHLYTGLGTYLRAGRKWHELFDASVTAGLDFRDASRQELIAFDDADMDFASRWPPSPLRAVPRHEARSSG
jgi:hypothetical protein